jgi:Subtilase family
VDKYIQQTGVTGAGITIGVISDDATSLSLIQGRGELPMSAKVVQPSVNPMTHSSLTDEGTMMLEEVFAVAPGATLLFCGPETSTEYLGCVQNLIAAGATVISDDLAFAGFDVMSASTENEAALALENLLTGNPQIMLYHSAGNDAQDYWQGAYDPLQLQAGATCSPSGQAAQTDNYFQQFGSLTALSWQTAGGNSLLLASVLPTGQANPNNIDLYVYDAGTSQVVACATSAGGYTDGATSFTSIDGSAIANGNYKLIVGTQDASLSGTLLKLIGVGDGADTFSPVTSGAPASPQDFAVGVLMVGAVNGSDGIGNTIEPYSDTGPIQLELPSPSILQAPQVVAPDAVYIDNSGTHFTASGGIFFGTSAASPNAAAVAVLLRSAFPALTPAQVTTSMEAGAALLGSSSPNNTFGYGRVDALGALAALPAPTITPIGNQSVVGGMTSGQLAFTLGGTGALAVKAGSDNAGLVAANSQAIAISPSTCGTSTTSCTVTISPMLGQVGTAHITVSIADGAQRAASAPFTVTVTKPVPPRVSVTTGATQTLTEGGTLTPVTFTVAGTQTLAVAVSSSNSTLLPQSMVTVTSGCGSKVSTCTVVLTVASGQAGSSTLTIMATDPYAQSGSATATVTVNAPPSKGGGKLDLWTLLVLGSLVLLRASTSTRKGLVRRAD